MRAGYVSLAQVLACMYLIHCQVACSSFHVRDVNITWQMQLLLLSLIGLPLFLRRCTCIINLWELLLSALYCHGLVYFGIAASC